MFRFKQLRCSFCRKNSSQVEKLVAGPRAYTGARVYICDDCVAIASEIMNAPPDQKTPSAEQLSIWRTLSNRVRRFLGGHVQRLRLSVASN